MGFSEGERIQGTSSAGGEKVCRNGYFTAKG